MTGSFMAAACADVLTARNYPERQPMTTEEAINSLIGIKSLYCQGEGPRKALELAIAALRNDPAPTGPQRDIEAEYEILSKEHEKLKTLFGIIDAEKCAAVDRYRTAEDRLGTLFAALALAHRAAQRLEGEQG